MTDVGWVTPNVVTGLAATLVILMGVRGLLPHLMQKDRTEAFHLAAAFVLVLVSGAGRTGYWDLLRLATGPDTWLIIREVFGGIQANSFWNTLLLWGGLHLLKLEHLILPRSDVKKYSMWTAWMYPLHPTRVFRQMKRGRKRDR